MRRASCNHAVRGNLCASAVADKQCGGYDHVLVCAAVYTISDMFISHNPCADAGPGRGALCHRLRSMITTGDCVGHKPYSYSTPRPSPKPLNANLRCRTLAIPSPNVWLMQLSRTGALNPEAPKPFGTT